MTAAPARPRSPPLDAASRLVADALEPGWNTARRARAAARDDYRKATAPATAPGQQQRDKIRALAESLPALWNDPGTPVRERKRLIRLLITDVTLTRGDDTITAAVRFPGGRHHILRLPVPQNAWQLRTTPSQITALISQLPDTCTYAQIAGQLNTPGQTTSAGHPRHRQPGSDPHAQATPVISSRHKRCSMEPDRSSARPWCCW